VIALASLAAFPLRLPKRASQPCYSPASRKPFSVSWNNRRHWGFYWGCAGSSPTLTEILEVTGLPCMSNGREFMLCSLALCFLVWR
jgi:hypothetical protein